MHQADPSDITTSANQREPQQRFLGLLRTVVLIALVVGAAGSLVFMFRAGQQTPRFLLTLFTIWVLFPFAVLLWANMVSKRWSDLTRWTLYCVTLIIALGSAAIYGELIHLRPAGSANAFLFVAVPPISLLFIAMAVMTATFIAGKLSRRGDDH
jgi:hypothetical protein